MESEKLFRIGFGKKATYVFVGPEFGRILRRPEVAELARSYGSEVKESSRFSGIEIVPPIHRNQLDKLGGQLVELATNLDPTPPVPDYKIEDAKNLPLF